MTLSVNGRPGDFQFPSEGSTPSSVTIPCNHTAMGNNTAKVMFNGVWWSLCHGCDGWFDLKGGLMIPGKDMTSWGSKD